MKIRNRHLVNFAGRLCTTSAKLVFQTLRFQYRPLGIPLAPRQLPASCTDRHIYCIWHENLLLPAIYFGGDSLSVLISKHADGQFLGALIDSMDMVQIQGSTNRGGINAVRQILNDPNARRHLAVTPDGPRGPRRVIQPGIVYIASRANMKIICVGVGYQKPWRAGSWDRFAFPKPCSRAACITSEPITVPGDLKSEGLEQYRGIVQREMDRLNEMAEILAETNHMPVDSSSTQSFKHRKAG